MFHTVYNFRQHNKILWAYLTVTLLFGSMAHGAELKTKTLEAWERYRELTEERIALELAAAGDGFLVQDFLPAQERDTCRRDVLEDKLCVQQMQTRRSDNNKIKVPDGIIHHWMASIRIPDAKLSRLMKWLQDYDEHERYFEEVVRSRLLSRNGDAFTIFYRLRRKKVITVHYNTEHEVLYRQHDSNRISSVSRAVRIAELDRAGTAEEREKPLGDDRGFLWRLNTYWRFQQVDDDVMMSCESISLSRGIPMLVSWFIKGIVNSVPRESLESTLGGIRDGYSDGLAEQRPVPDKEPFPD